MYRVTYRDGTSRDFASKQAALDAAQAELRSGWPATVIHLPSGRIIWGPRPQPTV